MKKVLDNDSNMFMTTPEDRSKILKDMMELAVEEERPLGVLADAFSVRMIEGFEDTSDFIDCRCSVEDIMEGAIKLSKNGIKKPTIYDLLDILCDDILFKFDTGSDFVVCIDER